jgi:hypothetical protein
MIDVLAENQLQVAFAGDQHPVQALAAGAGNPAFRESVRRRGSATFASPLPETCGVSRIWGSSISSGRGGRPASSPAKTVASDRLR